MDPRRIPAEPAYKQVLVGNDYQMVEQKPKDEIKKSPLVDYDHDDEMAWRIKENVAMKNLNMSMDEVAADPELAAKYIRPFEEHLAQIPGMWILNPPYGGARNKLNGRPVYIWANIGGDSVIACGAPGEEVDLVWRTYNPGGARRHATKRAIENGRKGKLAEAVKGASTANRIDAVLKERRRLKAKRAKQARKKNR